jgi:hypothetical protein
MLLVGRQRQRTSHGLDRRAFVQVGASSVLGLSVAGMLRAGAATTGSARSVLLLWLWGGPSQLDTWDPKPNAPMEYRGPFGVIPTRVTGVRVCELFPQIASITNKLAIIRSLYTFSNDHGIAGTIGLTGSKGGAVGLDGKPQAGSTRPATGSVVARALSPTTRKKKELPPFMVVGGKLHQGKKPIIGEGGGPLGNLYDPFRLVYDATEEKTRVPGLELPTGLTPERLGDREKLLTAFENAKRKQDAQPLDEYRAQAFAMLTSRSAVKAFDLSNEPEKVKDHYGRTRFGQSCLLGRRLIEAGVPFVQVNWSDHVEAEEDSGDGGWDHHYRNFQIMQDRHAPWLDQALPALLDDLEQRGLLASTLVVIMGEFGRQPKINDKAGREHWEHCYSALFAGGGVKGGRVIGSSDARAERPHDRPLTPGDVAATVHHAIGLTSEQIQTLGLAVQGKVVDELF